ncbi:MAG: DUF4190 domain-containing protein [Planctomycetes bacterium]|nr:DUF4190 domain-containing protein [Planctomycetota bacterium]MCW8136667.1 DUF4190 domain-containing protein [Planctomycetota bacterium]
MAQYFIETTSGRKGPFPPDAIARGIRQGKIPLGAKLIEDGTGRSFKAAEVAHMADAPEPPVAESGSHEPAQPARNPQYYAPRPVAVHPPMPPAQQAYPQQAYPQQAYPQQAYPQQGAYPYPGNTAYPQAYTAPYGNAYQPYGAQPQPYYAAKPNSGLAIASLVMSILTFATCLPTWIGGIICGVMALKETEPNGPKQGRGLALAGLWMGVGFGVCYLLFIVLLIAAES